MKVNSATEREFKLSNLVLLIMVFFLVFFAPLLPLSIQPVVNSTSLYYYIPDCRPESGQLS